MKRPLIALTILAAALVSAHGATIQLTATIDSTLNGTGSPATGTAEATLDDVTGLMTITGSFSGLEGNSTVIHLHGLTSAPNSGNAGVLFGLTFAGGAGTTSGTFSGSGTLSAAEIAGVLEGRSYVNIHSQVDPGGEIRGYMNQIPEPGSAALATLAAGGLLLRRRR